MKPSHNTNKNKICFVTHLNPSTVYVMLDLLITCTENTSDNLHLICTNIQYTQSLTHTHTNLCTYMYVIHRATQSYALNKFKFCSETSARIWYFGVFILIFLSNFSFCFYWRCFVNNCSFQH